MKRQKSILAALVILLTLGNARNGECQWVKLPGDNAARYFAVIGTNLFYAFTNGVYHSTDSGTSWTQVDSGFILADPQITALAASNNDLFAVQAGEGVFLSTNEGTNWTKVNTTGMTDTFVGPIAVRGSSLFAGTDKGVFYSTGGSWTARGLANKNITSLGAYGPYLFAGALPGLFISTNDGMNWSSSIELGDVANSYAIIDTEIFVGTSGGVYSSLNGGVSWTLDSTGLGYYPGVGSLEVIGAGTSSPILIAGCTYGAFISTDKGASWKAENTGLTALQVSALAIIGDNIFLATLEDGIGGDGIYRRSLSDFGTSGVSQVAPIENSVTSYPNPFSSSTTINFTSPESGVAEISVVNILGTEVARLFEGELSAGEHSFTWEANSLPPGMYECIVEMNGRVERVPMVFAN